ncbi:MAG: hypothetical protein KJ811_03735 [Candidatus Margulisbacteria bacterium]|nr:hypothetical protein [Candidatus Margulisiibacteriota bacterium]
MTEIQDLATVLYVRDYLDYIEHHEEMVGRIDAHTIQRANTEGLDAALSSLLGRINSNNTVVQQVVTLLNLPVGTTRISGRILGQNVLTSQDSITDLMQTIETVRESDLSQEHKNVLTQILVIRDFLDYIQHHEEIVEQYDQTTIRLGNSRGLDEALSRLLRRINGNPDHVNEIVRMYTLPEGTTRISARQLSQLILPWEEGIQDLVVALCTMNNQHSFCPSTTGMNMREVPRGAGYTAQGEPDGAGVELTVSGNNLPENATITILIPLANDAEVPQGITPITVGETRYIPDPNIEIIDGDDGNDALTFQRRNGADGTATHDRYSMHVRVRSSAALETQRIILIRSTDFERYEAIETTGFNVVETPLPTITATGTISDVTRARAEGEEGEAIEPTLGTAAIADIPEGFDMTGVETRVEVLLGSDVDDNITVSNVARDGNNVTFQLAASAEAALEGARSVRITLVRGDDEQGAILTGEMTVVAPPAVEDDTPPPPPPPTPDRTSNEIWAGVGEFFSVNELSLYARAMASLSTYYFDMGGETSIRDSLDPALQDSMENGGLPSLEMMIGSDLNPVTIYGRHDTSARNSGILQLMGWAAATFQYFTHHHEGGENTRTGSVEVGVRPRIFFGEQSSGFIDFGGYYGFEQLNLENDNFYDFNGPRHSYGATFGGGYSNGRFTARLAALYRGQSFTQQLGHVQDFSGELNLGGGRLELEGRFNQLTQRAPDARVFFEMLAGGLDQPDYDVDQLTGSHVDDVRRYRVGVETRWTNTSFSIFSDPYIRAMYTREEISGSNPIDILNITAGIDLGRSRGTFGGGWHIDLSFEYRGNPSAYYGGRQMLLTLFAQSPYLVNAFMTINLTRDQVTALQAAPVGGIGIDLMQLPQLIGGGRAVHATAAAADGE